MNIIDRKLIVLSLAAAAAMGVSAQESATGYFMENYNMKWQMNPAMGNRNNYVGFPGLGNLNVTANGNISPTDVVYPLGGKTVLFTNPGISAEEALGNFKNINRISQSAAIGVLQAGFKAFGGYNNVAINVRETSSFALPKSIFSLVKEGIGNKEYDIRDLHAKAEAYAEIAFNHSRDIKQVPGLRAGVSLKFLLPVGFAEADFNDLNLLLAEDTWKARSNARLRIGLDGIRYKTDINDRTGARYVSGVDTDDTKFGINGFGFGIDLGASYKWNDFNFSLAFTDLGAIRYNSVQEASTNGTKDFETAAHPIAIGDEGKSWDDFVDALSPLYELHDNGTVSSSTSLLGKMRVGVDYKFPYYDKLHFGLMNTTSLSSMFPSTEFRLSANVEPVKGVAVSVSGAAGTYGANYGFLLSLGNKGFNFLLGMDYAALKMDKNSIPLTSNVDVHLGINFPF
ncbi:MAG: hypothetical protein K2M83_06675 [Muribaculaceae bacterium]|nr:hypothetical protein [Bacteroides sp.]MDE6193650.1 hypothetical protein [Muribaculaceae bacterium]